MIANQPTYPKVSQENIQDVVEILTQHLANPNYLPNSTYSVLMQKKIQEQSAILLNLMAKGKFSTTNDPENTSTEETPKDHFGETLTLSEKRRLEKEELQLNEERQKQQAEEIRQRKELIELEKEEREIKAAFSSLAENMDDRSSEYKEHFGIVIRLEKQIRSVEKIATKGSTDSVKLTAATKLMEYQEKQLDAIERLLNVEKVNKIESLTRKFFYELKNHPDLKIVADRYLSLLTDAT